MSSSTSYSFEAGSKSKKKKSSNECSKAGDKKSLPSSSSSTGDTVSKNDMNGKSKHTANSINNNSEMNRNNNHEDKLSGDRNNNPSVCKKVKSSTANNKLNNQTSTECARQTIHSLGTPVEMDATMKEKIANYETFIRRQFSSRKGFSSVSSSNSSVDAFTNEVIGTFRYSNSHSPARVFINPSESSNCQEYNEAPKLRKSFSQLRSDHQKFSSHNRPSPEQINHGLLEKLMQKQKEQQQQQSSSPLSTLERPLSAISQSTISPTNSIGNISPRSPNSSPSHTLSSPGTSSHVLKHIRSTSNPLMKPTIAPKPRYKSVNSPSTSPTKSPTIDQSPGILIANKSTPCTSTIVEESLNEIKCKDDNNSVKFTSPFKCRQFRYLSLRKYSAPILKSFQSKSNCTCSSSSPSRCKCEPFKSLISTSSIASYANYNVQKENSSADGKSESNSQSHSSKHLSSSHSPPADVIGELKSKLKPNIVDDQVIATAKFKNNSFSGKIPPASRTISPPSVTASSGVSASIVKKRAMRKRSKSLDPAGAAVALGLSCPANTLITDTNHLQVIDDSSVNLMPHRRSHSPPSDSDCDSDYSDETCIKENNSRRHERLSRLDSLRRCEKNEITSDTNSLSNDNECDNEQTQHHHHHAHHSETGKRVNYKSSNDHRLSCFSSSSSSTCSSFKSTPPASPYLCTSGGSKSRLTSKQRAADTVDYIGKLSATSSSSTLTSSNAAIDKVNDATVNSKEDHDGAENVATIELSPEEKRQRKLYFIASELTTTEAQFVDKMNLLAVELKEIAQRHLPKEQIAELFKYLDVLRNVSSFLLQELEKSFDSYKTNHKIAHVLVQIGPFLNCYSCFMVEFDKLKSMFDDCLRRYPAFASEVKDFELSDRCQKLSVKHYLLKPIQRIPQYRLLLEDYLKNLPEGHVDYDDAVKALAIVSTVAEHANQVIKEGDSFMKLLAIQNSLFPNKEIIKPGRVFLKQGDLMKVSRKELQQRRVVLCSDCLFYLTLLQSGLYHLNHEIPLDCMRVSTQKEEHSAYNNELTIISPFRSLILQAKSTNERDSWYTAITSAIDEYNTRKRTFQKNRSECFVNANSGDNSNDHPAHLNNGHSCANNGNNQLTDSDSVNSYNYRRNSNSMTRTSGGGSSSPILGDECPIWVPDDRVTMCQQCYSEFSAFFRRHHCRACGKVVCRQCSANRVPLRYRKFRVSRVCDTCFVRLRQMMEEKKNTRQGITDVTLSLGSPSPVMSVKMMDSANVTKVKSATLKSTCSTASNNSGNYATASDSELDYDKLIAQFTRMSVPRLSKRKAKEVPASLKVNGNDASSNLRGYLFMKKKNKSKFKRYWFVVKDKVLYRFNASEDVIALNSEVLLGWKLQLSTEPLDTHPAHSVFHLIHEGRPTMTFATESPEQRDLWVDVITAALVL